MSAVELLQEFDFGLHRATANADGTLNCDALKHATIRAALRVGKLAIDFRSRGSQEWLCLLGGRPC